jgi:hypothetical protein
MSAELEARNTAIYKMFSVGKPIQDIAEQFGISRQRVAQIIARVGTVGVSDDESRTLQRAQLEYLQSEMIAIVHNGPAPAVNVKGEIIVDSNGVEVSDYSGVISAADTARKISESIRRQDALDLPRRKQIVEDEARRQADAALSWYRNQAITITAEVIDPQDSQDPESSVPSASSTEDTSPPW